VVLCEGEREVVVVLVDSELGGEVLEWRIGGVGDL